MGLLVLPTPLDQQWVYEALPGRYLAARGSPIEQQEIGGLEGQLPVLIGLIASSVRPHKSKQHCKLTWVVITGHRTDRLEMDLSFVKVLPFTQGQKESLSDQGRGQIGEDFSPVAIARP